MIRVAGVLTVNRESVDRRPWWPDGLIFDALAAFVPGTVAILDGHNAASIPARRVGSLDELAIQADGSLRFAGTVTDAAIVARLARGPLPVSAEYRRPGVSRTAVSVVTADPPPPGVLYAVAILTDARPARPGSLVWIATD